MGGLLYAKCPQMHWHELGYLWFQIGEQANTDIEVDMSVWSRIT